MKKTYLKKTLTSVIAGLLALASLSFAAPASATVTLDAAGLNIDFSNDVSPDSTIGEVTRYENVITIDGQIVDALLSITGVTSEITQIEDLDDYDYDPSTAIDNWFGLYPDVDPDAVFTPADGYTGGMTVKVEFVLGGTNTPVTLLHVGFFVKDIDTYQYFEVPIPTTYTFDANPALSALYHTDNSVIPDDYIRFQEMNGIESESTEQPFWVFVTYDALSTLEYTIGQDIPGGAHFIVKFEPVTFDNPEEHTGDPTPPALVKRSKTVFFDGDSAYLKPIWFKKLDKFIASIPTCATNVSAKVFSGVKKAKSKAKGPSLAKQRAAIVKKFLTKRGLNVTVNLKPNGKGTKSLNSKRFAKVVVSYSECK